MRTKNESLVYERRKRIVFLHLTVGWKANREQETPHLYSLTVFSRTNSNQVQWEWCFSSMPQQMLFLLLWCSCLCVWCQFLKESFMTEEQMCCLSTFENKSSKCCVYLERFTECERRRVLKPIDCFDDETKNEVKWGVWVIDGFVDVHRKDQVSEVFCFSSMLRLLLLFLCLQIRSLLDIV